MGILKNIGNSILDVARQPATFAQKLGTTVGKKLAETKVGQSIKQSTGLTGSKKLEQALQRASVLTASGRDLSPFKSVKEGAGEAVLAATNLASPLLGGSSAGVNIAKGALYGASSGAGSALRENLSGKKVIQSSITGAVIGAATTGLFEALGGIAHKIQQYPKRVYNVALQPKTGQLADDIAHGFETVGERVAKEGYTGSYQAMRKQANLNLEKNGNLLTEKLKGIVTTIDRADVEDDVLKSLESTYGSLDDNQISTIQKIVSKMPKKMSAINALEWKRTIDKNIPTKIFEITDPKIGFKANADYQVRDALRKAIEDVAGDEKTTIRILNGKLGTALDVRHLTSYQEALLEKSGIIKMPGGSVSKPGFTELLTTQFAKLFEGSGGQYANTSIAHLILGIGKVSNKPAIKALGGAAASLAPLLQASGIQAATKAIGGEQTTDEPQVNAQSDIREFNFNPQGVGAIPAEASFDPGVAGAILAE